jgi:hypothetical protein
MPEDDFEESARLYEAGQMSRRRFIGRLVAGGISATAAIALVNASGPAAFANTFRRRDGHYGSAPCHYGTPPGRYGQGPGRYGRPPGQYGKAPGQYGRAPGQYGKAPGHYGKAPGHYGTAPGHYGKAPRRRDDSRRDSGSRGRRR